MAEYEASYTKIVEALDAALLDLERSVPPPKKVGQQAGYAYRFVEKLPQQALLLKCARMLSALKSAKLLLENRLVLDVGSTMRILDELLIDILFISGSLLHECRPEPRHQQYLNEFFQEDFDYDGLVKSLRKRNRVGRKHIRAYVARTFFPREDVSKTIATTELIETAFSGFVHGAGVHTMEIFNGLNFLVQPRPNDEPLGEIKNQFPHYMERALIGFSFTAKAIGRLDLFNALVRVIYEYYDKGGRLKDPPGWAAH